MSDQSIIYPQPPRRISGYRSRAINAAVDFTAAARPIAGTGIETTPTPGGVILSARPQERTRAAMPWDVRIGVMPGDATGTLKRCVSVNLGVAVDMSSGSVLEYSSSGSAPAGSGVTAAEYLADTLEDGVKGVRLTLPPGSTMARSGRFLCVTRSGGGFILGWCRDAYVYDRHDGEVLAVAIARVSGTILFPAACGGVILLGDYSGKRTGHPSTDPVPVYLADTGNYANTDEWSIGDVDSADVLTYPVWTGTRTVYVQATRQLIEFKRYATYSAAGNLTHVGPEIQTVITQAVPEDL